MEKGGDKRREKREKRGWEKGESDTLSTRQTHPNTA